MWDSALDESGNPAERRPVSTVVSGEVDDPQLDLSPSMSWLSDPARQYPVTIDPTIASVGRGGDTYIKDTETTAGLHVDDHSWGIGYTGASKMRALLRFDDPVYSGGTAAAKVTSASLKLWNNDAYTCTAKPVYAYPITGVWNGNTLTWANQPAISTSSSYSSTKSFSHGFEGGGCANAYDSLDLTNLVKGWQSGAIDNNGIEIRASETDALQRKYFCSMNADTTGATSCVASSPSRRLPTLSVTYGQTPSTPAAPTISPVGAPSDANYTSDITPMFTGKADGRLGDTVKLTVEVHTSTTVTATTLKSSCVTATWVASNTNTSCSVATVLADNTTYYARTKATNSSGLGGAWSPFTTFKVAATAPAQPAITCASPYATSGHWEDAQSANVVCTASVAAGTATNNSPTKLLVSVDGAAETVTTMAAGAAASKSITFLASAKGGHSVSARATSRSDKPSTTKVHTLGWGAASLASPANKSATTGKFQITADGPPRGSSTVTATVRWRPAGSGADELVGWNTSPAAVSVPATAATEPVKASVLWDANSATVDTVPEPDVTLNARVPNLLDIQICLDYLTGSSHAVQCTWSQDKRSVLRVPHAFGNGYPTTDAGCRPPPWMRTMASRSLTTGSG